MFDLIRKILESIGNYKKVELKPEVRRFYISPHLISSALTRLEIKRLYGRLDNGYYYTDLEGWGQVLRWIYLTQELPKYSVNSKLQWNLDCEDFALWLKAMVSLHFGLNTCAFVIGDMPQGRHGFNMILADEWYLWEPHPGYGIEEPFDILDENKYKPLYALV